MRVTTYFDLTRKTFFGCAYPGRHRCRNSLYACRDSPDRAYDLWPFSCATIPGALIGWPLVLLGTVLLFLSLLGTPSKYLPKVFVYLGRISYGLHIYHALILYLVFHTWRAGLSRLSATLHVSHWRDALGTVLVLILTLFVASLSYRFFESPFLRLKRRFTFVPSRD